MATLLPSSTYRRGGDDAPRRDREVFSSRMRAKWVVGIDEVGRGALGGAVTVAAFAFLRGSRVPRGAPPLRDSKRLTPRAREEWFARLVRGAARGAFAFSTARVSARLVDRMNIRRAADLAATRAYVRLVERSGIAPRRCVVLLDGGLSLHPPRALAPRAVWALTRGDERIPEIQLASIVAKVTRDRAMVRLDARYPAYGLARHKGYGTPAHLRALARHGAAEGFHRLTFVQKFLRVRTV